MRTITSKKNAIAYFENGTKVETRKTIEGKEYRVAIPPVGFKRMFVYFAHCPEIAYVYQSWNWCDYVELLTKSNILKLKVYYE